MIFGSTLLNLTFLLWNLLIKCCIEWVHFFFANIPFSRKKWLSIFRQRLEFHSYQEIFRVIKALPRCHIRCNFQEHFNIPSRRWCCHCQGLHKPLKNSAKCEKMHFSSTLSRSIGKKVATTVMNPPHFQRKNIELVFEQNVNKNGTIEISSWDNLSNEHLHAHCKKKQIAPFLVIFCCRLGKNVRKFFGD